MLCGRIESRRGRPHRPHDRGPGVAVARAVLLTAVWLGILGAGAAGAVAERGDERRPLERYAPVLRYDADERFFAQPVHRQALAGGGDRVYGRVAREDGERWLQYWFFYAYNPQDRGILRTGRHEGDWEFAQFRLSESGEPELATLAQHTWAEGCEWDELEYEASGPAAAPALYVANGSHALYSRPGTHDRPWPDPNDEADGEGRRVRPRVTVIGDTAPAWVRSEEPWGESRAGIVPAEQSSPPGPMFQADGRWSRPASFHADRAIGCGAKPPSRSWQTWALIAAVAGFVALAVVFQRRRRGSV